MTTDDSSSVVGTAVPEDEPMTAVEAVEAMEAAETEDTEVWCPPLRLCCTPVPATETEVDDEDEAAAAAAIKEEIPVKLLKVAVDAVPES
jgi:hypothetical protein